VDFLKEKHPQDWKEPSIFFYSTTGLAQHKLDSLDKEVAWHTISHPMQQTMWDMALLAATRSDVEYGLFVSSWAGGLEKCYA
jgi:hypothetical protein